MSIALVTFAGSSIHKEYQKEFHTLYRDFLNAGHEDYDKEWLVYTKFYQENQQLFKYEKYCGYFLWKPYIISLALNYYDYVIYCDSNVRFTDLNKFRKILLDKVNSNKPLFIKHANFINAHWTKRDTFYYMNRDSDMYWNSHQVWTPVLGFSKNEIPLLNDYLEYCRDPRLVTELPNECGLPNLPGFREHRWEQSVLSNLVVDYDYEYLWDTDTIHYITKIYSPELMKMKEEVNKNPLKERI